MKNALIILFILFLSFVAYVRYLESISVFHPNRQIIATPQALRLNFEDIYFKTKDNVSINGWLIKNRHAKITLLYLHGNAGNMTDRLDKIELFYKMGLNIFIIDYRGYGRSTGRPSEHGVYEDAQAAYDFLISRSDIKTDKIVVYGASLGGVVAVDLATKRPVHGLIIDSTFSSAADMAKRMYPYIPSCLLQTKMDSMTKIQNLMMPKLFIHSSEDNLVPIELGRKLYEKAPNPKEFLEVKGGHNDSHIFSQDIWGKGITQFLKRYL